MRVHHAAWWCVWWCVVKLMVLNGVGGVGGAGDVGGGVGVGAAAGAAGLKPPPGLSSGMYPKATLEIPQGPVGLAPFACLLGFKLRVQN